jgi:hypothetical protein
MGDDTTRWAEESTAVVANRANIGDALPELTGGEGARTGEATGAGSCFFLRRKPAIAKSGL